ncbi:hypothetical protein K431DRAFT_301876 [Polychaeton citri CBS 116435]|uniref:Uncharacterized protein n=1 Tax=Polychaeton citri CBS 116435 TaxID=1314669 RepID=A0A9P4QC96_9PEZI|nr:hypothetical protein K431DRAFT_301876 [Polychaeton citri CBS 116435]
MSSEIRDRYIWFVAGVLFYAAAKGIQYAIRDVIHLTRVNDSPSLTREDHHEDSLEDSISIQTLKTLTEHPNPKIRNAAVSILVNQSMGGPASIQSQIRREVSNYDAEQREHDRAGRVMRLLIHWDGDRVTVPDREDIDFVNPIFQPDGTFIWANDGDWTETAAQPPIYEADRAARQSNLGFQPRERNEDALEAERRRRRREAMVLHEGSGQVMEEDIFRPV